eukprot:c57134_g1_i1 orf=2-598(-)
MASTLQGKGHPSLETLPLPNTMLSPPRSVRDVKKKFAGLEQDDCEFDIIETSSVRPRRLMHDLDTEGAHTMPRLDRGGNGWPPLSLETTRQAGGPIGMVDSQPTLDTSQQSSPEDQLEENPRIGSQKARNDPQQRMTLRSTVRGQEGRPSAPLDQMAERIHSQLNVTDWDWSQNSMLQKLSDLLHSEGWWGTEDSRTGG